MTSDNPAVLLMHGFGVLANRYVPHHLTRVRPLFEQAGFDVLMPQNAPYSRPGPRAQRWKDALLSTWPGRPVSLVAHSQGGIEALLLASDPELADRITSVHLIASPLRGTPAAAGLALLPAGLLTRLSRLLERESRRLDPGASPDLPGAAGALLRPPALPDPGLPVFSYLCSAGPADALRLPPPLLPLWVVNGLFSGANDGLVPLKSQAFGTVRGPFSLHHGEQLGLFRNRALVEPRFLALWDTVIRDVRAGRATDAR